MTQRHILPSSYSLHPSLDSLTQGIFVLCVLEPLGQLDIPDDIVVANGLTILLNVVFQVFGLSKRNLMLDC